MEFFGDRGRGGGWIKPRLRAQARPTTPINSAGIRGGGGGSPRYFYEKFSSHVCGEEFFNERRGKKFCLELEIPTALANFRVRDARGRAPSTVRLLYAKRAQCAREQSRTLLEKEKKEQGRKERRKERRRHYSTHFLVPSNGAALVSRIYVNGLLLKRPGNQIHINGPSSVSLDADFMTDDHARVQSDARAFKKKNRTRVMIPPAFDYYMYARALRARFRTLVGFFFFCDAAINLSQFIQKRSQ